MFRPGEVILWKSIDRRSHTLPKNAATVMEIAIRRIPSDPVPLVKARALCWCTSRLFAARAVLVMEKPERAMILDTDPIYAWCASEPDG
jgi:hypothetical protein